MSQAGAKGAAKKKPVQQKQDFALKALRLEKIIFSKKMSLEARFNAVNSLFASFKEPLAVIHTFFEIIGIKKVSLDVEIADRLYLRAAAFQIENYLTYLKGEETAGRMTQVEVEQKANQMLTALSDATAIPVSNLITSHQELNPTSAFQVTSKITEEELTALLDNMDPEEGAFESRVYALAQAIWDRNSAEVLYLLESAENPKELADTLRIRTGSPEAEKPKACKPEVFAGVLQELERLLTGGRDENALFVSRRFLRAVRSENGQVLFYETIKEFIEEETSQFALSYVVAFVDICSARDDWKKDLSQAMNLFSEKNSKWTPDAILEQIFGFNPKDKTYASEEHQALHEHFMSL